MKEQFVPYEIAIKLQEKGFDWHCLAVYMNGEFQIPRGFGMAIVTTEQVDILKGKAILAPLWQQCLEWLEREHWVDFWAVPILTPNPKQYECFIMYRGKEISCEILGIRFFNSYNDARQTAVEKILKHI
jgi:hypothetical protein